MRLNRLRLCNFRQYIDTTIEFDVGITGIIGPNGSGKTTILEAIAWALYGMPAARGTRESIRAYKAAPGEAVTVELDFDLAGHRYFISRKLNSAEVFLDGASAPIASSISGVSDLIRRRLGMSHDEFFNTYFAEQKELGVMAAMGPTERAQFLSRVLGYERLRTAQEMVRKRRSAIESEIKGLRAGMPEPEVVHRALADATQRLDLAEARVASAVEERDQARRALDDIVPQWERIQLERDAMQALVAELRVVDGDRLARERDRDRIQHELEEIRLAREELERLTAELVQLSALQAELRELERASNEEARHRTLTDGFRALSEELVALSARRTEIQSAPSFEAEAMEELSRVRAEHQQTQAQFEAAQSDWVRDKQEAETKRKSLLDQLRDVQQQRDQIIELGENGICPICARPLETHFRSVLEVLDTQIAEITFNGKYFRSRIDQLATIPAEVTTLEERRQELGAQADKLQVRLAKIQAAIQHLNVLVRDIEVKEKRRDELTAELATIAVAYDAARHADVRKLVERLTPLSARAARLSAQLERETLLIPEQERVAATLAQIAARVTDLTMRRDLLAFSELSFIAMREVYERAVETLRTADLASVAIDAEVAAARRARASADQARADLERAEAQLEDLTRERRLHDELDRAFGEIRTDLNQELRPELSDRASRYIEELTDGRYSELQLDDQYNVIVLEDAIPKPVISGGEEDLANLVLRLAISEMIAERAGQAFSLLILDEIFGSLDETRQHNVVALLRRLQDRFEQVILITHIESVREGLDRVVEVCYDEESGTSSVGTEPRTATVDVDLQAGAAD